MTSFRIDVITANRMCNFAVEFDVENKGLNTLCRASWLLDHDMFEVNIIHTIIILFSHLIFNTFFIIIGCYGYLSK